MTDKRCAECAHASTNPALLDIPMMEWRFQARITGEGDVVSCRRWGFSQLVFVNERNGCFVDRSAFDLADYYRRSRT